MSGEQFYRMDGSRIEHQVYNPSYLKARPPILFFHGSPGSCRSAEVYCEEFIKYKYPVFSITRPGYGKSVLTDRMRSFSEQAKMVKEILEDYEVDYVIVYGVSGGAAAALDFCKLYTSNVVGLILESAVVSPYDAKRGTLYQRWSDKILFSGIGRYLYSVAVTYVPTLAYYLLLVRYSTMALRRLGFEVNIIRYDNIILDRTQKLINDILQDEVRPAGYDNDLNELLKDRTGHLASIPKHTLVLHGTADAETPINGVDCVSVVNQKTTTHAIIDGSHLLPLSSRHQYVSDVKTRFLHRILNHIDRQ